MSPALQAPSAPTRRTALRGIGAGAFALAGAGTLGACSSRDVADGATGAAPDAGFTITDQRGKRVAFDRPVERIATAIIPSPSMIAAVDGSHARIVGINESTLQANKDGIFGTVFPESKKTATIAGADFIPNVETALSLKPDVVIQWGDQGDEVIAPLENAGFKVIGLTYGTQEKLETWIDVFGTLVGKKERATSLVQWMHDEDKAIRALVTPEVRNRTTVLYLRTAADGWTTVNKSHYMNHWADIAGGVNVARDEATGTPQVSVEQLLRWDPEVILLSGFDATTPADLYADRKLASLRAVRARRVYKIPLGGYRWDPPCCESPLMWRWVAQILHPRLATRIGLRTRIEQTFDHLYGYAISRDQVDGVLRLGMNGGSSGYDGFGA
ncbi:MULTISPECIES: ABC transporter substrate-binding protein [unclassified Streptomyces]|uniref:ABC transporter substrate-binding protein n=1 Tax=unclassified Streptomyces TaxID=2593676 RepID=UPI0016613EF3|nr:MULTISPECIES: ABC transporter substrate-binding protein [unclassified Streptomyces]MBD0711141.1 Fe3+-citrate ABC transporter substrate-binding protein [Streptomyces sp. CBMA291]MBD0714172.1 Fe3+-citrate ABC transporter substrate-binding protein [Streptomyces sp. CBMA370]